MSRINAATKMNFSPDVVTKRPVVPLEVLRAQNVMRDFLAVYDWVVDEIERS